MCLSLNPYWGTCLEVVGGQSPLSPDNHHHHFLDPRDPGPAMAGDRPLDDTDGSTDRIKACGRWHVLIVTEVKS